MAAFRVFLASIGSDWVGKMSGGGGLLLTMVGFFVPGEWGRWLFLAVGIAALFTACYRAWLKQYQHELDRARLRELLDNLIAHRAYGVHSLLNELPNTDEEYQIWSKKQEAWKANVIFSLTSYGIAHRFDPLGVLEDRPEFRQVSGQLLRKELNMLAMRLDKLTALIDETEKALSFGALVSARPAPTTLGALPGRRT